MSYQDLTEQEKHELMIKSVSSLSALEFTKRAIEAFIPESEGDVKYKQTALKAYSEQFARIDEILEERDLAIAKEQLEQLLDYLTRAREDCDDPECPVHGEKRAKHWDN
jgi:DNA-directed RNA polymerase subunit F